MTNVSPDLRDQRREHDAWIKELQRRRLPEVNDYFIVKSSINVTATVGNGLTDIDFGGMSFTEAPFPTFTAFAVFDIRGQIRHWTIDSSGLYVGATVLLVSAGTGTAVMYWKVEGAA